MISVFVFLFYTKLLFMFCCSCFFTGLDVDFVVSFFVVIKHFCFFVLCRKRKEKKYNVLGQVVG